MHFRNLKKMAQDVSLDEPIEGNKEGNPISIMDTLYSEDTIADDLNRDFNAAKIRGLIKEIKDPKSHAVITMRYGLDGGEPLTQREVAEKLQISRSYVSRIEKKAISGLRKFFEEE
ncbi:MAG: helix-turn-helix domain-containing protein [Oscillospiraceae bacterium]|nr:helix-turn-helix domain-containing protein [Oscillospiraceae bacterium]